MKRIKELVDHIDDELEGAKEYAEEYLDRKAHGDQNLAQKYKTMAEDELRHAGVIHDRAVVEIEQLQGVYTPPADMEEAWKASHKKYVEQAAWVKQMLVM